jgi:hypothetical protein
VPSVALRASPGPTSIEQTIETGGTRRRRTASAQAATRVSAFELDDLRRQITAQVAKAFTEVLVAEASLALAPEDLRTLDDVLRLPRFTFRETALEHVRALGNHAVALHEVEAAVGRPLEEQE